MFSSFSDLERKLVNEQKKCDDHIIIRGLETYISTVWAAGFKEGTSAQDLARAKAVAQALAGYTQADVDTRRHMITRALAILRGQVEPEPISQVEADSLADTEPDPDPSLDSSEILEADAADDEEEIRSLPPMHNADKYGLDASVTRLQNVGPAYAKRLARLGINSIYDLLYHFPRRYDDYSELKTISQLVYGEEVTLVLTVCEAKTRKTFHGLKVTNVILSDATGTIQAVYYNQPFLQKQFKNGDRVVISGRVESNLNHLAFKRPEWEPLSNELLHTGRIVPRYPLTEGLTNRWLRRLIHGVVKFWAPRITDSLPAQIREQQNLQDLETALTEIHFPTLPEKMKEARRRLAFEEFLCIQLGVLRQRRKWREQPSRPIRVDPQIIDDFKASLSFQMTGAQSRALVEILKDISEPFPMSRLLQGDVGSGKTVVAAAALLATVESGAQAAVLAPTEILAEQHFKTLSKLFGDRVRLALLTGSLKNREKEEIRDAIASGDVDVVVGTHALIQASVRFKELALAVIDEQHRFGVEQRGSIRAKGYNPHILVMSATPIPRTLALTVYGDLDLSLLDEMPPGRQAIKTKWLDPQGRERAYSFINKQVGLGRQAFVICPLIEESEAIDAKAAVDEYERLRTDVFPNLRVGLIHGKLKPAEKDAAMAAFRDHELDILVATSVVEVGIDIPNATVMLIEGADRFGLAQLHQFRGRVGRGPHESYCLLLAEKKESVSDERLRIIESTQDGFRLAEEDLKLRGPGEFFGTRQSGLPDLKIAKLSDVRYLEQARDSALALFDVDAELAAPEHLALAERVNAFWKDKGDLS